MPDVSPTRKAIFTKLWRLFLFAGAAIYVSAICVAVAILHNPEWHEHLLRLIGRAWAVFVARNMGSTSLGALNGTLEVLVGICVVAAMTGFLHGWKELQKHIAETAIIALFAFPTVALILYGTQFAWETAKLVYADHDDLVTANQSLASDRSALRGHPIVQSVPVIVESKVIKAEDIADTFELATHLQTMIKFTAVYISAAPNSPESENFARMTTAIMWDACYREGGPILYPGHEKYDCEAVEGQSPYIVNKADYRLSTPPPESGVIIHSESEEAASTMAGYLSKLFSDVTWTQEMPRQVNEFIPHDGYKTFVWVEFGKHVTIHKYDH